MQRLFNLDKWSTLGSGQVLSFTNKRARNIRLEVNAPVETALHLVDNEGVVHFLALVKGRETVEFGVSGAFDLMVEGEPVNVYTADGANIAHRHEVPPAIFTKIIERRRRNPELERMQHKMTQNMEKRLAQMQRDWEAQQRPVLSDGAVSEEPAAKPAKAPAKAGASEPASPGDGAEVQDADSASEQGTDDET